MAIVPVAAAEGLIPCKRRAAVLLQSVIIGSILQNCPVRLDLRQPFRWTRSISHGEPVLDVKAVSACAPALPELLQPAVRRSFRKRFRVFQEACKHYVSRGVESLRRCNCFCPLCSYGLITLQTTSYTVEIL